MAVELWCEYSRGGIAAKARKDADWFTPDTSISGDEADVAVVELVGERSRESESLRKFDKYILHVSLNAKVYSRWL